MTFVPSKSDRILKKNRKLVKNVREKIEQYKDYNQERLRELTTKLREEVQGGKSLDSVLPTAFALTAIASKNVLNMMPFDCQIEGGIILHQGRIAEMRTGEGKTLVATMPVFLNALEGKGVHVVTVNEYLAKRDMEEMGQVYGYLGLTTGLSLSGISPEAKRAAYACDITYVTNSELGFDYLRDNMVIDSKEKVLRGLHYVVIDEVDSILIDEARTPLVIAGPGRGNTAIITACDFFVKSLTRGNDIQKMSKIDMLSGLIAEETGDYAVDEKEKRVVLTAQGIEKAEQFFKVENLSDASNVELQHRIDKALYANSLQKKERDYIVRSGEVMIVDEFTGRVMDGRRFADGLHQALEAKEGVTIQDENETLATITYQNFFNKFEKKCGMTGTAKTEELEFRTVYGINVVPIPTNRPIARKDETDRIFTTLDAKYAAIVEDIKKSHANGVPILVGTADIAVSEHISSLLAKEGITHHVLNAKNNELEAEIISHAGTYGAVTVATNMAGRGTDIKLDDKAREAGGLRVIGAQRHESRRIDNQLIGRSGRQGDPGSSIFYLSLEDDLLRLFGGDKIKMMMSQPGLLTGEEIPAGMLAKAITRAQKNIEGMHFDIRKNLLKYDEVMNEQREIIYEQRDEILACGSQADNLRFMLEKEIGAIYEDRNQKALDMILGRRTFKLDEAGGYKTVEEKALDALTEKMNGISDRVGDLQLRHLILSTIDQAFREHVEDMSALQNSIGLNAYANKDPYTEYRYRAYEAFEKMLSNVVFVILQRLFSIPEIVVSEVNGVQIISETTTL